MTFKYILFNKPYGVLCQFTGEEGDRTLSEFNLPKEVYAAGRLDKDSEGLLLLTNDGPFIKSLSDPRSKRVKTYWAQVEGVPKQEQLQRLQKGVVIKGHQTRPCKARRLPDFSYPEREPPIRYRKNIPTTWIELKLIEGRNRQVRRMCAAIGHPCLRLIRSGIGKLQLSELKEGEYREVLPSQV